MDTSFWLQRWEENDIGFHEDEVNPLLATQFKTLLLEKGHRIFMPLCGKTHDIAWLLSNGYQVAGAELSQLAVDQLFTELGVKPDISDTGTMLHYKAKGIDLFVGDIFDVTMDMLGPVNAVYDRAALVALPQKIRKQYATHLIQITDNATQLLICYEYDQTQMEGPPFSISAEEVHRHYANHYKINLLVSQEVSDGLKSLSTATEHAWLLKKC